jgi:hypothetical protein
MKRVVLTAIGLVALTGCASSSGATQAGPSAPTEATGSPTPSGHYTAPPATLPVPGTTVTMSTGPAPWPAPVLVGQGKDSAAYVAAAGLPYAEEMLSIHYHAHLDVVVDGKAVPVPAYLGFVAKGQSVQGLAPLHTHDFTGVIHIENDVPATFVLGQVFVEWGVRLSADCVGSYCTGGGKELAVFVNGKRVTDDPSRIVLAKHQEIAVVFGTPQQLINVPSSYKFSNGQ